MRSETSAFAIAGIAFLVLFTIGIVAFHIEQSNKDTLVGIELQGVDQIEIRPNPPQFARLSPDVQRYNVRPNVREMLYDVDIIKSQIQGLKAADSLTMDYFKSLINHEKDNIWYLQDLFLKTWGHLKGRRFTGSR